MPMPQEYFQASRDFDRFMDDVKRISMLQTHHQCYTMVEAVLHAFRSHLSFQDALTFADFLPPVLRAIFVAHWDLSVDIRPFPTRDVLQDEVMALRHNHNVSTPTAIEDVARALRMNCDPRDFERVLASLPPEAARFWAVPAQE